MWNWARKSSHFPGAGCHSSSPEKVFVCLMLTIHFPHLLPYLLAISSFLVHYISFTHDFISRHQHERCFVCYLLPFMPLRFDVEKYTFFFLLNSNNRHQKHQHYQITLWNLSSVRGLNVEQATLPHFILEFRIFFSAISTGRRVRMEKSLLEG